MSDVWNPEDKKGEEPFEGKFDTWKDVFDYYIKDENLLETHRAKGIIGKPVTHGPANVKGGDYYLVDFGVVTPTKNLCYVKKIYDFSRTQTDNIYFFPIQEYIEPNPSGSDMLLNRVDWARGGNLLWSEIYTKFYKIDMSETFDLFMNWINENPFEVKQ